MENKASLSEVLLDFIINTSGPIPSELHGTRNQDLENATIELLVNILYHINAFPLGSGSFFDRCKEAAARLRAREEGEQHVPSKDNPVRPSEFLALIALNAGSLERRLTPMPAVVPSKPGPGAAQPEIMKEGSGQDGFELDMYDLVPRAARAILKIYDPSLHIDAPGAHGVTGENVSADESMSERRAKRAWSELDPATFRYWRMGTTSMIIRCSKFAVESAAYAEDLILKCVVFPWNLIPAIAESTSSYADRYKDLDSIVVRATASSDRWVLMPYQDGPTLAEHYKAQEFNQKTFFKQMAFASEIALQLAAGLDALSAGAPLSQLTNEHQHLDLSPSNVIMARGATPEEGRMIKFIDLGENYLYTRQIGMADHDDAAYVAPEVKNKSSAPSSDLFSLAVITIELLSGIKVRDGRVPDAVYEISPAIGRLLDDMLDDDYTKRLLLVPHGDEMRFSDVSRYLRETFDLVKHEPVASSSAFERRWAQWAPASHEVGSLLAKLWDLKSKESRRRLQDQVGYLAFMSLIASAAWWYIFTRCALFHFDDFITGDWAALPHGQLLYASVIGFSQGMTASKFYQTILARLTLRDVHLWMARVTEIGMRLMTIVAVPTTLLAVSWRPQLWAWTCAIGAAVVAVTNLLALRMAVQLSRRGREQFSTVPVVARQVPGGFEQWWWTMLMYAFVIALIAIGLQTGWMKDAPAYVIGLLVINFAIHYASKCVLAGAAVRGGLARAFATGERLSALLHPSTGGLVHGDLSSMGS
jgi:hypothetical protein